MGNHEHNHLRTLKHALAIRGCSVNERIDLSNRRVIFHTLFRTALEPTPKLAPGLKVAGFLSLQKAAIKKFRKKRVNVRYDVNGSTVRGKIEDGQSENSNK